MSRLTVLHAYNWLDPKNGGPPRVILGLAAAQRALGAEVRLVSSDKADSEAVRRFLGERLTPLPPRTVVRPKFFLPLFHLPRLVAALKGVDVAHLHGIWPPATLLTSQVCRLMGVPYVLAPHGSLHRGALAERRPRKWVGMHLLGYGDMIAHAAALHALNAEEADGASGLRLPARVEVIPNGVFPEEFQALPPLGGFRARTPGLGDAPYILFLSRVHWGKGPDLLGEAFVQVAAARPDVHLVVVGEDHGGLMGLKAPLAKAGLLPRLHVVGPLFGPEKALALRDAAVYCLPSRHEGFSMAITEAMALGRPVVVTETCHFPEVASEGAGRVVALHPDAIASGLLEVLGSPEAEAMGARGRALVMSRYTWPSIAQETLKLYRSLL